MAIPVYSTLLFAGAAGDEQELFTAPAGQLVVVVDVRIGAIPSSTPNWVRFVDNPAETIGWANFSLVGNDNDGYTSAKWQGRQVYNTGTSMYIRTSLGRSFLRLRVTGYTLNLP